MCFGRVFFFKQKTAYELRISDWSSDVCSSDLIAVASGEAHSILHLCRRLGPQHETGAGAPEVPGRVASVPGVTRGEGGCRERLRHLVALERRRRWSAATRRCLPRAMLVEALAHLGTDHLCEAADLGGGIAGDVARTGRQWGRERRGL